MHVCSLCMGIGVPDLVGGSVIQEEIPSRVSLQGWGFSGIARRVQKGQFPPPPFFQERIGGRAICHVMILGDEQTRRGTGYGD